MAKIDKRNLAGQDPLCRQEEIAIIAKGETPIDRQRSNAKCHAEHPKSHKRIQGARIVALVLAQVLALALALALALVLVLVLALAVGLLGHHRRSPAIFGQREPDFGLKKIFNRLQTI